ncbi:MAG: hypothetical protein HZB54_02860 [Deltaproteobacteria bacterium]|nr:hypothetical protein [Deltaproteobacteria bacterium]
MKNEHDIQHFASPFRLLIITALSIFFTELLVMFILSYLPPLSVPAEALVDSLLLIIPVFPILYIFLFRPMILHIAHRGEIEQKLKKSYDELEIRVRERTSELASANESLRSEITERKRTEEALMKNRASLIEAQRIAHLGNWD